MVAEKKVECGEIFHTAADKSRCLVENKVLYYLITEYRGSSYKFYTLHIRQGGHVIVVVCLYVCLSVSNFAQKRLNGFTWNFRGRLANRPMNKQLNFGGDPRHGSVPDPDPNRDTGKTCFSGGMHCPSASTWTCICIVDCSLWYFDIKKMWEYILDLHTLWKYDCWKQLFAVISIKYSEITNKKMKCRTL